MKRLIALVLLLPLLRSFAQDIPVRPNPPRLVNDLAHVLTADQAGALEQKLVAYNDSTSTQIVLITVPTIGDAPIEDYARNILRTWGVGNKKNNNGIVIVAAINDHKARIETGYGMEGSIPDITASHIIESEMAPNFRSNNYYRGFDQALDAIFLAAAGEYKAPEGYDNNKSQKKIPALGGFLILLIIIFVLSRIGGGGGGGGMMSRRGFSPWLGAALLSSLGRGGGGGGFGGGFGGGGGGGGFGGFGGGGGGGGGASGSW